MTRTLLAGLALVLLVVPGPVPTQADEENPAEQDILALIAPRSGELIADLGCGSGTWTFALARAVGGHGLVFAVDIDQEVLEAVEARRTREGVENVKVVHSKPDDPTLPKGALDAVFLNDVIDFVNRQSTVGFLAGIHEALKEGGRLIIRDPNGNSDRVIAECYRAGFTLVEAKIPLPEAPSRSFSSDWYALKFSRSKVQHSLLPRLGKPAAHRTRLLLAEELFRAGLFDRKTLRKVWEQSAKQDDDGVDPRLADQLDLVAAAETLGICTKAHADELRARIRSR